MRSETPAPASAHTRRPGVGIVDLDRRVRSALADALAVAGIEIVGTAGDGTEALELVAAGAHVLVVDPRLPELADGYALVDRLTADWPDVHVVLMGWGDAGEAQLPVAGRAFIAKSASPEEFVAATMAACGY
jgi:DNA-binding NarL/FixJ family response regulator